MDWTINESPTGQAQNFGIPVFEPEPAALPQRNADSLDIKPIRERLAVYEDQLLTMQAEAEVIKVTDDESAAKATELGATLRKIEKAVEDARKHFKRPALDFGKQVDDLAGVYIEKAKAAAGTLGRKVGQYQAQKKREELERLQKEQEAARKLQEQVAKEAEASGVEAPAVIIPKAAPAPAPIRTAAGKGTLVERWVCTIINPALVPREYCEPVQSLLNAAVKNGIRNIPGCEIKLEANTRFGG